MGGCCMETQQPLEEMAAFFNKRRDIYDEVHTSHIGGGLESKRVLASFLPAETRTLLDLGIGTGLELEAIFARFPAMRVTGLDIADKMLDKLREKYPGRRLTLRVEDYLTADLGRERYDAALSVMTLHHHTHDVKRALYRRIRDCLRPGGVYIESDYILTGDGAQEQEEALFAAYRRLKREQGIADGVACHFDTPCTLENEMRLIREAGFTGVDVMWQRENTVVLRAVW